MGKKGESRKNIKKHEKNAENVEKHRKTGRIRGKQKNTKKQGESGEKIIEQGLNRENQRKT